MASTSQTSQKVTAGLSVVLLVVAVALIVLQLVLDAGPSRESPRWIIFVAIFSALAGGGLGAWNRQRAGDHRPRR